MQPQHGPAVPFAHRAGVECQKAADFLTAQGFNVVRVAAAERNDYHSSQVQVLTEDRRSAEALATMLKVPSTAIRTSTSASTTPAASAPT